MTQQLLDLFKLLVKPAGVVDSFRHWQADWGPATDVAGYNCTVQRYDDGSLLVVPTNPALASMTIAMSLELQDYYNGDWASLRLSARWATATQSVAASWVENVNGVLHSPASSGASAANPAGYSDQALVFNRGATPAGYGQRRLQVRLVFTRLGGALTNVKIMPDPAGGLVSPPPATPFIKTSTVLYVGPSKYMVETPVVAGATQEITGDTISIHASRGNSLKGAIDQLEPGVLKAIVKGAEYEPGVNLALRPGSAVWLVGRDVPTSDDWRCVWSGKVLNGDVSYDGTETKVTIEATDHVADLANTGAPQSYGRYDAVTGADAGSNTRASVRMQELIKRYAPRLFYTMQDEAAPGITPIPQLQDQDDGASVLDQLQRIRDTSRGVAWLGAGDPWVVSAGPPVVRDPLRVPGPRLFFNSGTVAINYVPRYTFTDNPADAGLKYTDVKVSFSARALLNSVKLRVHQVNTDVTYGPYRNMDSYTQWGPQEDTVELLELTNWVGLLGAAPDAGVTAQDFLRRFATPIRYPSSVTVNVTEDVTPALLSDVNDAARVKRGVLDVTVRVLRLTHTITANRKRPERARWQLQLDTRPDWQTAAVPVTAPDATIDPQAPGSSEGNTDPGAIQPYTRLTRRGADYDFTFAAGNNGLGIPHALFWDTTLENVGIPYDGTNRWWTIPKSGRYLIAGRVSFLIPAGQGAGYMYCVVLVNGVEKGRTYMYHGDNAVRTNEHTQVLRLTAGDHVQLGAGHLNNGSTYRVSSSSGTATPDDRTSCALTYLGG